MATKRIKDLTNTATTIASDEFLAVDGTTNGTSKITRDNFRQDTADAFVAAPGTYNLAPLSGGAVPIANGGTAATSAAAARTNLSVNSVDEDAEAIGTKLLGPSIYFDGNDFIEIADDQRLSFTDGTRDLPFSISAWVKMEDATNFTVASKYSSANEWRFYVNLLDDLSLALTDGTNSAFVVADTALTAREGEWVHVACTYNGAGPGAANSFAAAANGIILYISGVAVPVTATNNASYSGMADTSDPVRLGRHAGVYAEGHIRGVSIFNRELTAAEVADLSKGNELGFADQWAGALGGIYTQDTTPSGEWTGVNVTDADEAGPIGGRSNILKLTINTASSVNHYATLSVSGSLTTGKRYKFSGFAYVPSTNSNCDGFRAYEIGYPGVDNFTPTLDTWVPFEYEAVYNGASLVVIMADGGTLLFADAGSNDVIYFDGIKVTEIGTLADFRSENFDTETGVLTDISSNRFQGVNNGATLVGEDMPLHAVTRTQLSQNIGTKLLGPSVYFDGSNDVVTVADDSRFTFSDGSSDLPFTVSAWVKADDWTRFTVAAKWGGASPNREWAFASYADQLRLFLADSSGNRVVALTTATLTAYEGQWIHVAATYSADSETVSDIAIYINGVSQSLTNANSGTYGGMSDSGQNVEVGFYTFDGSNYSKGHIRNVQIYNRELTAAEVADLARGNELGFSDQYAGAYGGIYAQDATPSGEWTSSNATDTDEAGPVGGKSNVLRVTSNTATSTHYVYQSLLTEGKRYRIKFSYRIPSGQSNIDGIGVYVGSSNVTTIVAASTKTLDTWVTVDEEFVAEASANVDRIYIYGSDNTSLSFTDAGGDDYFDIAEMTVTEIGTLADFRSERFDSSTGKWYDLSDNAFVGTNSGATLVGREVPVYETGTWTPVLTFGGGSTGLTYTAQEGYYTRIGDTVFVTGGFTLSAKGSSTGTAAITLPFTSRNMTDDFQSFSVGRVVSMAALTSAVHGYILDNSTEARLLDTDTTGSSVLTEANFTDTSEVNFSLTYKIQ